MNTHDHDDDDALPGEDALKALYRSLPRKDPTPALDEAVRRAAAEAVRTARRGRMPRWPVTAASAAVLVLAAGLSWRLLEQPSNVPQIPTPAVATHAPSTPVPPAAAVAPSSTGAPAGALAAPSQAEADMPARYTRAKQPPMQTAARQAAKVPATNAPTLPRTPSPLESPPARMAMAAPEAAQQPAPPPPPAPMAPAPAMAAPPAAMEAPALRPQAGFNARSAGTMKTMALPAMEPTAFSATDTPEQELDKIRQLFAMQRRDEALQRLAAFRQAHPDLPLPDDLRAQLPDHE